MESPAAKGQRGSSTAGRVASWLHLTKDTVIAESNRNTSLLELVSQQGSIDNTAAVAAVVSRDVVVAKHVVESQSVKGRGPRDRLSRP